MKSVNHLKKISLEVNKYFIKFGVTLNFKGYTHFRKRLSTIKDEDVLKIFELIKETNFWYEYISELEQVTQLILEEYTSKRNYYDSLSLLETNEGKLDEYDYYYQAVKKLDRFYKTIKAVRIELGTTSFNLSNLYYKSYQKLNWGFNPY